MKVLRIMSFFGLLYGMAGCASMSSSQNTSQSSAQAASNVEQMMLQSAQKVQKTLNDLEVLEQGPPREDSSKSLIDSTVAAHPAPPTHSALKDDNHAAASAATTTLKADAAASAATTTLKAGVGSGPPSPAATMDSPPQGEFSLLLDVDNTRLPVDAGSVWPSMVNLHWEGDAQGFIKVVAQTLNYRVMVQGAAREWPDVYIDSGAYSLQKVWEMFSSQVLSAARIQVSDSARTIYIIYRK